MTDLTQVLRWNTNFVRGLAESVLERAKLIRETLDNSISKTPVVKLKAKKNVAAKKALKRIAKTSRKSKRKNG